MQVRQAIPSDQTSLIDMRTALWPSSTNENKHTLETYFKMDRKHRAKFVDQILVCESNDAQLVGFIELHLRNYAEGSENIAVPYIEGWYVAPNLRQAGVGRLLVSGAEDWARTNGYTELASDSELANTDSIAAHLALGFMEADRTVSFIKQLD